MELNLLERFILIAQHPNKGRFIISDMHINYGIIGAALLEMSFNEQIIIENDMLFLKKDKNTNCQIISILVESIKNSKKPRKLKYWIPKLARKSHKYKWMILEHLKQKDFIRIENKKFLGIISYRKNYLIKNKERNHLINQIKDNILNTRNLSNDDVLILGLIEACKMQKIIISDKNEIKIINKKLKEIIKESPIAETVDKTIKQMQAAIIGAIAASTIAASIGGTN